jgi:hypothetical protein
MVPVAITGNISAEATTPAGNIFNEAMRHRRTPPRAAITGGAKTDAE